MLFQDTSQFPNIHLRHIKINDRQIIRSSEEENPSLKTIASKSYFMAKRDEHS